MGGLYFNWQSYITRQQLAYFPIFLSPCIVSSKAPKTKANIRARAPPRITWILSSHLQDGNLLPVAQDPEGKGMSGPKAWDHLTASEGKGIHVGFEVCAVLVEI